MNNFEEIENLVLSKFIEGCPYPCDDVKVVNNYKYHGYTTTVNLRNGMLVCLYVSSDSKGKSAVLSGRITSDSTNSIGEPNFVRNVRDILVDYSTGIGHVSNTLREYFDKCHIIANQEINKGVLRPFSTPMHVNPGEMRKRVLENVRNQYISIVSGVSYNTPKRINGSIYTCNNLIFSFSQNIQIKLTLGSNDFGYAIYASIVSEVRDKNGKVVMRNPIYVNEKGEPVRTKSVDTVILPLEIVESDLYSKVIEYINYCIKMTESLMHMIRS